MSKPRLLFVAESPFSDRDRRRFGVEELSQLFDVAVVDTTPVVAPTIWHRMGHVQVNDSRVTTVSTHRELVDYLRSTECAAVISNLGVHEQRHAVYQAALRQNSLKTELQLGTLPGDDLIARRAVTKFEVRLKQLTHPLQSVSLAIDKIRRRRYRDDVPDLVVHGGLAARRRMEGRVQTFIEAHSLDYELVLERSAASPDVPVEPLAVYLDQDLGFHPDHDHSHLRSPVDPARFYPELLAYLRHFEQESNLRVIVAPHPRASRDVLRERFSGFEVADEPTVDLVRRATCALAHVSTSISFAVLWDKPTLFLGGPQLMRSWYEPYITAFADFLSRPIVDTSRLDGSTKAALARPVDAGAYRRYVQEYLSSRPADGARLWDIVSAALLRELAARR